MGIIGSIEGAVSGAVGGAGQLIGDLKILGHLQGSVEIDGKRVQLTPEAVRKATAERDRADRSE